MQNDLDACIAGSGAGLGLLYPNLSLVNKIECPVLVVHVSAHLLLATRQDFLGGESMGRWSNSANISPSEANSN